MKKGPREKNGTTKMEKNNLINFSSIVAEILIHDVDDDDDDVGKSWQNI